MIGELISSIQAIQDPPVQPIRPPQLDNAKFNPFLLEEKLMDISNLSDSELFEFVKNNYKEIINTIFSNESKYIKLFLDRRFLTDLIAILSNQNSIDFIIKSNICKIAFDYMSSTKMQKDEVVHSLIQQLAEVVNRDTIYNLTSFIPKNIALYLTVAKYSTNNESINIQRMNYIIAQTGSSIFTEQAIINLYIHFGKYSGMRMTDLLESHMFSVDPSNMPEEMEEMYSTISMAILDMINHMTSPEIRQLLLNYSNDFVMKYNGDYKVIRFSLKSLSTDYNRITAIVDMLSNEGYNIP